MMGAAVLALAVVAAASSSASHASATRPNIVFMLADDWGWGDVGAYGANGNFALTGACDFSRQKKKSAFLVRNNHRVFD